jgi:outer membrane protein OmpA-like peptidoglycan-associated protein
MRRRSIWAVLGGLLAVASALPVRAQVQNSFSGPTGGIRIIDAGSGPKGSFRLALNTEFFVIRDYFVAHDRAHHFAGNLSLSVSATDYLEVFASAEVSSAWSDSNDPMLIQRVADVFLGVKGFYRAKPWVTLGGDFSMLFPGGVGDGGATFRATSFGFRGNVTLDFREHERRELPLIARFNLQYWFDNTANLTEGIEDSRYDALGGVTPRSLETRNLLTAFERFAYGVNRVDTVRLAAGMEAPIELDRVGLSPMLEWAWHIPVNRQGYDCVVATMPNDDSCLQQEKLKAFPMILSLGLRILSPPKGLAFTLAADIGLTGARTFVRELAPTGPYNIIVGVGYAFDPGASRRSGSAAPSPAAGTGHVRGHVLEEGVGEPVQGAVVQVVGHEASPQVTDAAGRFVSYDLPQGEAVLEISHPDYLSAQCPASVPSELDCLLVPAVVGGQLRLRTVDGKGDPVPGVAVAVRGPSEHELLSDDDGVAHVDEVEPGAYSAHIDDEVYLLAVRDFDISNRQETTVQIRAIRKPSRPRVVVKKSEIILRRQVSFATGSDEILPNSEPLLLEVADAMLRNPGIELVEIQGHTDNRGGHAVNMKLSQQRAESAKRWLAQHGIAAERLAAKGYGPTRPIAPNITAYNRARNRRVQFKIVRRVDEAP